MKTVTVRLIGTVPLMIHNGRLRNPLDQYAKALKILTAKRKKTDIDHMEISRLEWEGSLYLNNGQVVVPGIAIDRTFQNGAKLSKNGKSWQKGALVLDNVCPLCYKGEKIDIKMNGEIPNEQLDKYYPAFNTMEMKLIKGIAVLRTRAIFHDWSTTCQVSYDETIFDERTIQQILEGSGKYVGLLEERPRFGQFEITLC